MKKWKVLGPFIIGKNELDGEPWLTSNTSELVSGGIVKAASFKAGPDGQVQVDWSSKVGWQELVNAVGGHELLEWQALALGAFKLTEDSTALISCKGLTAFRVVGKHHAFVGDLYHAGLPGQPIMLKAGTYKIATRLRAKVQANFHCFVEVAQGSQQDPRPLDIFGGHFSTAPDVVVSDKGNEAWLPSDLIAVPVSSRVVVEDGASKDSDWIRNLRPLILSTTPKGASVILASEQPKSLPLAPGQMMRVPVRIALEGNGGCGKSVNERLIDVAIEGDIYGRTVRSGSFRVVMKCRKLGQSFTFTFKDDDGSIQHAAAIMPQSASSSGDRSCDGNGCPVLVTLSGTSITASDSADSYKVKFSGDKDYRFGVVGAWLLAPTRHGAHNWEGPGHLTALSALRALSEVASRLRVKEPDAGRVLVAGHSMGGHGLRAPKRNKSRLQ